ncbi:endoglucanase [Grimontia kaedaensis]|uniref:cellulase n=1 Tax=Grimontia kaedaensis TaxID=2872157 RepID=A0ABY4X140_9GAMM|nr:glycosyl hydrolase family 8 [Grimontia kaedaensis]USH04932.1 endoglucanase [Grimontia kaedaensis]
MNHALTSGLGLALFSLCSASHASASCDIDYEMWRVFKTSYISSDGRVIDNGNKGISHSEGQGYGMLIAEYFNDEDSFQKLWAWTKANLQREKDGLFSWKWQPQKPHIPDENNASDGDLIIAWALFRAHQRWPNSGYGSSAKKIATELRNTHIKKVADEYILMPGAYGFSFEQRTVTNLGYWVYPALNDFSRYSEKWSALSDSGLEILNLNLRGKDLLVSDWVENRSGQWQPAQGFPSTFSYSSYRIPLYLVWGNYSHRINQNYLRWLTKENTAWVDVLSDEEADYPPPAGAQAIAQLVALSNYRNTKGKTITVKPTGEDYYSDSLVLLAHIAYQERICR